MTGVSLATRALTLRDVEKLPIPEIAIRLFGVDTIAARRTVEDLIDEARLLSARAS